MLKPRACDRACVGMGCIISIETNKCQNGGRFKFRVCVFISGGKGGNKTAKRGVSFIHLSQQRNNTSEFSCRIYVFVEKHKDLCFYRGRLTQTGSPLFRLVP